MTKVVPRLSAEVDAPGWSTAAEAARLWFSAGTLRKTIKIALVVGSLLSLINQGALIFSGHATVTTWLRVGMNYLVPFCVSSTGFLAATRRHTRSPDPAN